MLPELSVIIPTYNRQHEVRRAVASVLSQGVAVEVVVVDDGSDQPLALDEVLIVRLRQNCGPAAARNAGVDAASADWIAFLDSDDVWPAGSLRPRLEEARAAANGENLIWAAGFVDLRVGRAPRVRIPKASADVSDFAAGCWSAPGSTALMTRAAWRRSGGQDPSLRRLEDYEWMLRWALKGGCLGVHAAVGAEIKGGGRASPLVIDLAARLIATKHDDIAAPLKRRMHSYLDLERGAALLHASAWARGAGALTRSWLLHPRLQPSLEPFWR